MKTERRHELETNELSIWLEDTVKAIEPYWKLIVGGIIALVVVVLVFRFTASQNRAKEGQAWSQLFDALEKRELQTTAISPQLQLPSGIDASRSEEELEKLAGRYQGTTAGAWARAHLAAIQLNEGLDLLFENRDEAKTQLEQAVKYYEEALKHANSDELQQYARYGLARAYEGLFELDKAQAEYKTLAEKWPDGIYTEVARKQLERLDSESGLAFYDWFSEQNPGATPGASPSSEPSEFPTSVPDPTDIDIDFSSSPLSSPDAGDGPAIKIPGLSDTPKKESSPATTPPAEEASTPPAEEPASPPADEPAKTPEKPAEPEASDTPAEKPAEPESADAPAKTPESETSPEDKPAEDPAPATP